MRVESRIPGADCNPYIAVAATIAGGLHGIRNQIEPPEPTSGNGYTAEIPRIPSTLVGGANETGKSTLVEAIDLFETSTVAKEAFGTEVHYHLLHHARQEWLAFNSTVTDWELRRNFERL